MNYLDTYLGEIEKRLPSRIAPDVVAELKGLLLEGLEERYGKDPSERELFDFLRSFGSPRQVARRYRGEKPLIAAGLEDLYRFILPVMAAGIALGFSVSWTVGFLSGSPLPAELGSSLLKLALSILSACFSGVGALTLTFILLSRLPLSFGPWSPESEWDPEELKGIIPADQVPSRLECAVTLGFTAVLIGLIPLWPQAAALAEGYARSLGFPLGHSLVIPRFASYIRVMGIVWALEGLYHIMLFRLRRWTVPIRVMETAVKLAAPLLSAIMFLDQGLYESYRGIAGFRFLFLLGALGGAVALGKYLLLELLPVFRKKRNFFS